MVQMTRLEANPSMESALKQGKEYSKAEEEHDHEVSGDSEDDDEVDDSDDGSADDDYDDDDDSSISDDEDGESVAMDELERWARNTLAGTSGSKVTGKIHRNNSSPAISALFIPDTARGQPAQQSEESFMKRSDSAPALGGLMPASLLARMQAAETVGLDTMMRAKRDGAPKKPKKSPQDHLNRILKDKGVDPKRAKALDLLGTFFLKMSDENIKAYDFRKARAVRTGDIDTLREIHQQGSLMQCCNQYKESIVHTACRRGSVDVVRFLIKEAGVSLRVIDDYGRTPLHDACWTSQPCFELIELLITHMSDLLYVSDARGYYPLDYVRKENWDAWIDFLDTHKDYVVPRELYKVPAS